MVWLQTPWSLYWDKINTSGQGVDFWFLFFGPVLAMLSPTLAYFAIRPFSVMVRKNVKLQIFHGLSLFTGLVVLSAWSVFWWQSLRWVIDCSEPGPCSFILYKPASVPDDYYSRPLEGSAVCKSQVGRRIKGRLFTPREDPYAAGDASLWKTRVWDLDDIVRAYGCSLTGWDGRDGWLRDP